MTDPRRCRPSVPPDRRDGFTIIELLIAIVLGGMLVTTAFAAFRVAQGFISVGQRRSDENHLIMAGYRYAMNEVDTWNGHRAQADTSPDRAYGFAGPLDERLLDMIDNQPTEDWWHWSDRFDPVDTASATEAWHGRQWRFPGLGGNDYQAMHGFLTRVPTWTDAPPRELLHRKLGWYGYLEYVPSHAIVAEAGTFLGHEGFDGHGFNHWCDWGAATIWEDDRKKGTRNTEYEGVYDDPHGGYAFALDDPQAGTRTPADILWQPLRNDTELVDIADLPDKSKRWHLLPSALRPDHLPDLQVSVQRSIEFGERKMTVEIGGRSPVDGRIMMLRFRAWGTTLRGARILHGLESLPTYD